MQNAAELPERRLDTKIMDAWREAAKELEIHVEIPFTLTTSDGRTEVYEGRAVNLGGPNGMVFAALNDDKGSWKRRKDAGYSWSDLGPNYRRYDRDLFMATLDDWKWSGAKGQEPAWYSGKNWS